MVRNRVEIALLAAGIVITLVQGDLPRLAVQIQPPLPSRPPGASGPPSVATQVSVIWREFRPGERQTGPGTTVRVCAAALERATTKSALVIRFCDALPESPQRRFAFGYDDLVVRAQLPGGVVLAYDLLDYVPTAEGGAQFAQRVLPENSAPLAQVRVDDTTDVVFVIAREMPVGLPSVDVTARYNGIDVHEVVAFPPLGADLEATEAARVSAAPKWARAGY
jgi:hypothetical protein